MSAGQLSFPALQISRTLSATPRASASRTADKRDFTSAFLPAFAAASHRRSVRGSTPAASAANLKGVPSRTAATIFRCVAGVSFDGRPPRFPATYGHSPVCRKDAAAVECEDTSEGHPMTDHKTLYFGHGYKASDRVRVVTCPARRDLEGKIGYLVNTPAVGFNPILRVRVQGANHPVEIDGTAEKFERLDEPHYD